MDVRRDGAPPFQVAATSSVSDDQGIMEFYNGKSVLVTGCTGFLGKVLLEKLLWEFCTPAFEAAAGSGSYGGPLINVLIRSSAKSSAQERFNELMEVDAFGRLRRRLGDSFLRQFLQQCVEVIDGDIESDGLGLPTASYANLADKLDIVFHCAAMVAWGAPVHSSLLTNAAGSRRVSQLAKDARVDYGRTVRFVDISTCWVHGMRTGSCPELAMAQMLAGKQVWPALDHHAEFQRCLDKAAEVKQASFSAESVLLCEQEALKRLGPSAKPADLQAAADEIRARKVDSHMVVWGLKHVRQFGWGDGYTFSKAIGELFVGEVQGDVPYAVVRPSGIVCAVAEPIPGWLDAYLLVEPLIEGVGKGQITTFPGEPKCVIDCVPVDYVVNVTVVAAAKLPTEKSLSGHAAHVYQCASGDVSPNTLLEIEATWQEYFKHSPLKDHGKDVVGLKPIKFAPDVEGFASSMRRRVVTPLSVALQAVETVPFWNSMGPTRQARAWLERKRRSVEKVLTLATLYGTYTCNEWVFESINSRALMGGLSQSDTAHFPYFPDLPFDWASFWATKHVPGMRRWVLKEAGAPAPIGGWQPLSKL